MPVYVNLDEGPDEQPLQAFRPSSGQSFSSAVGATFKENPILGLGFDYLRSIESQRQTPTKVPRLEAESLIKQAGVKVDLPDSGYSRETLDFLIQRKQDQEMRASVNERTPWGAGSIVRGAGMLAAGAVDPTSWIPGVRGVTVPSMVVKSTMTRIAERAAVGAIEGATAAALVEPLSVGLKFAMDDDYQLTDSLVNVGFGAVVGGVLHPAGGAIRDRMTQARVSSIVASELAKTGVPAGSPSIQVVEKMVGDMGGAERPSAAQMLARQDMPPEQAQAITLEQARQELIAELGATDAPTVEQLQPARQGDSPQAADQPQAAKAWKATPDEIQAIERGEIPERFRHVFNEKVQAITSTASITKAIKDSPDTPATVVAAMATPQQREVAMRTAVAQMNDGRMPDVENIIRGGESNPPAMPDADTLAVGDAATAKRLDEVAKEVSEPQKLLDEAMEDLRLLQENLELGGVKTVAADSVLKQADADLARSKKLGQGLIQAVICGIRS